MGCVKKMMLKFKSLRQGVTLVELMVTVSIFLLLLTGVYTTLAASSQSWETNRVKIELQQELRKGMEWMINDLRRTGNAAIADVPADGNWYNSITFKTPSGVTAGSVTWGADNVQFVLAGANADQLTRIESGVSRVLAQNVQALQFRRLASNPNNLEVALQGQKNTLNGRPIDYQLAFEVQLRN